MKWTIDSWQNYPIKQVPTYNDGNELKNIEDELSLRPPLVFAEEVRRLRRRLASVAEGKAFLLQGGDCAESFLEHNANNIRDSFKVILQMAAVLTYSCCGCFGLSASHDYTDYVWRSIGGRNNFSNCEKYGG